MLLKWHDAFMVGHKDLDNEHKRLLDIINDIAAAETGDASGRTASLLNALHMVAIEHFRHENSVMCEIIAGAYAGQVNHGCLSEGVVNEHRAEHARALIALENMLHLYESGQMTALAPRLTNWFVEHATDKDAQLRAYFKLG